MDINNHTNMDISYVPRTIISNLREDMSNNLIDEEYYNKFFSILQQLTDAPKIPYRMFVIYVNSLPLNHHVYVYKVLKSNNNTVEYEILGTMTLIIEQKLIHGGAKCGHIEDLVVDEKSRGQNIAHELLQFAKDRCRCSGCYKVILDCDEKLAGFYKKNGFSFGDQMMRYNIMGNNQ